MKKLVRKGNKLFFSIILTALFLSAIQAQIFTGAGFTITDGGGRVATSCSTITVSGITTSVNVRSVSINNLNHTWIGDTQTMVYRPGAAVPPAFGDTISSPPDDRACNFAGTYRYIDSGAATIDAATVGPCASATNIAPGDYRTSEYFGASGTGNPPTSLTTLFGSLTPAQANGNWLVCVFDYATPDGGTVGSTSLQLTVLSAASVAVGGRVTTADGRGIGKIRVSLTGSSGTPQTALTNPFGYYRFEGVETGANYIITASSKSYTFANPTVVHFALEDNDDINFTANP